MLVICSKSSGVSALEQGRCKGSWEQDRLSEKGGVKAHGGNGWLVFRCFPPVRIEETWRLWQKFLDDYSHFEDWLKPAERTAAYPNSSEVLYTNAKEELKRFEVMTPSSPGLLITKPAAGSGAAKMTPLSGGLPPFLARATQSITHHQLLGQLCKTLPIMQLPCTELGSL